MPTRLGAIPLGSASLDDPAIFDWYKALTLSLLGDRQREVFIVVHVDRQLLFLGLSRHKGSATRVDIPFAQVLTIAASLGSAGQILAHNQQSECVQPSASDRWATRKLCLATEAMGVAMIYHLIFGDDACISMRKLGLH